MQFGESKPSLLSLLSMPAVAPSSSYSGQSQDYIQQQQMRQDQREAAMDRYFPPQQVQDNTAMLPLLQILTHGSVPAPLGPVQMPPQDPSVQQQPQQPQAGVM